MENLALRYKITIYVLIWVVIGSIIFFIDAIRFVQINFPSFLLIFFYPTGLAMFFTQEFGDGGNTLAFVISTLIINIVIFGTLGFILGMIIEKLSK